MKRELGEQLGLHWMHVWLEQDKKSKVPSQDEPVEQPVSSTHPQLTQDSPQQDLKVSQ